MNIENTIITIYCLVAESLGKVRLWERGFESGLSDAEVLTMEIVGEMGRDGINLQTLK